MVDDPEGNRRGVAYRLSKNLDDQDEENHGLDFQEIVRGTDTGDGWLRVQLPRPQATTEVEVGYRYETQPGQDIFGHRDAFTVVGLHADGGVRVRCERNGEEDVIHPETFFRHQKLLFRFGTLFINNAAMQPILSKFVSSATFSEYDLLRILLQDHSAGSASEKPFGCCFDQCQRVPKHWRAMSRRLRHLCCLPQSRRSGLLHDVGLTQSKAKHAFLLKRAEEKASKIARKNRRRKNTTRKSGESNRDVSFDPDCSFIVN